MIPVADQTTLKSVPLPAVLEPSKSIKATGESSVSVSLYRIPKEATIVPPLAVHVASSWYALN